MKDQPLFFSLLVYTALSSGIFLIWKLTVLVELLLIEHKAKSRAKRTGE